MIHDKRNFASNQKIGAQAPAKRAGPSESETVRPPKESVTFGASPDLMSPGIAVGMGAAATALMGAGSLAGLSAGLTCFAGVGAAGALIGGAMGAALGKELGGVLSKNAEEVANKQRTRRADGRFRTKSGATQIDSLRETYGPNFAAGLPGNMPLQVLRASTGMSLTQLVKNPDAISQKKEELNAWEPPKPAPGGRTRNADGRIRQKRSDTKIDTLRKTYGLDFAAQLPGNWPLAILRHATGKSLSQLVDTPDIIKAALPDMKTNASGPDNALKG
jgi:hypothetical protein